jgi:hypothetical protein
MAKPFFRGTWKKWLWGSKMDKMVTRGRLSIHLKNASKLSKEWGEGHEVGDDAVPDGLIGEESDDAHLSAALRTKEGVNLKNCLASAKFGRRLIFF